MATHTTCRYDDDFYLWTKEQARLLREARERGLNVPLDWDNLAEEVESLGRSERREIESRLDTLIEHLLKLQYSRAIRPRDGWKATVSRGRLELSRVLRDNPSLRREVPDLIEEAFPRMVETVALGLSDVPADLGERIQRPYTEDEVLGSWLPDDPAPPRRGRGRSGS
jgi:hypothetical protein